MKNVWVYKIYPFQDIIFSTFNVEVKGKVRAIERSLKFNVSVLVKWREIKKNTDKGSLKEDKN